MEDFREQEKYYPTLVSNIYGIKEKREGYNRTQKIKKLPKKAQDILFSDEIVEFVFDMERRYNLNDISTEEVSRSIRQYFLREITQEIFIQKIAQLCNTTSQEATQLLQKINSITPKNLQEKKENIIKMSLKQILEKYPQVLNQIITNKEIVSKPFLKPLKPTIKNWIMVYEKIIGVGSHSAIERGEFLFRSDVARGLSGDDRNKLSIIFKSKDENFELLFDVDEEKIVFDEKEKSKNEVSDMKKNNITPNPIPTPKPKQPQLMIKNETQQSQVNQNEMQQINKIPQNQNDVLIDELQKEITKNRLEMQGMQVNTTTQQMKNQENDTTQTQVVKNQREIGMPIVTPQIAITPQKTITNNTSQNNQEVLQSNKKVTSTQSQNIKPKTNTPGKISFSSKHILPVEKEQGF